MKSLDSFALIALMAFFIASCGSDTNEIQNSLHIQKVAKTNYLEVPDKVRFNDTFSAPNTQKEESQFQFALPIGWAETEKAQFRDINISFAAEEKATCYMTILPLKGGDVLLNLNRWRGQFDLAPLTSVPEKDFETIQFMGKATNLYKLQGDYKPLAINGKNFTTYGLIQNDSLNAYTIKFLGPSEFISKEKTHFVEWVNSIKKIQNNKETNQDAEKTLPMIPENLKWSTPPDWVLGEAKPPRVAIFKPFNKESPECSISIASGSVLENINRWRSQMGLKPLENISQQEKEDFSCQIGEGLCVFLEGSFSGGMSGKPIENALMAGAIIQGANKTVFIKMTGAKDEVLKEKASFLLLIKSIKGGE